MTEPNDNDDSVQCDLCDRWHHINCVEIKKKIWKIEKNPQSNAQLACLKFHFLIWTIRILKTYFIQQILDFYVFIVCFRQHINMVKYWYSLIREFHLMHPLTGTICIKMEERLIQKYQRWDHMGSIQKQPSTGIWQEYWRPPKVSVWQKRNILRQTTCL